jgi:hypothetical protein
MTYSFDPELAPWAAIVPTPNYDDPAAARARRGLYLPRCRPTSRRSR